MVRVRDIMTADVVTITPDASLREAAELFARRRVGGAPVVDGQRVVGVVSASDILTFLASARAVAATTDRWVANDEEDDGGWRDGDEEEDGAARFFAEQWIPILTDPTELFADAAARDALLDGHTVAEVMTERIVAVEPQADVSVAGERMQAADVHRVLVMQGSALEGIISTTDLARAVAARGLGPDTRSRRPRAR